MGELRGWGPRARGSAAFALLTTVCREKPMNTELERETKVGKINRIAPLRPAPPHP